MTAPGTGTPRWVKAFAVVGGIIVLVLVVLLLIGGNHGPGRHVSQGGAEVGGGVSCPAGDHRWR